jgi:hypothetical protein
MPHTQEAARLNAVVDTPEGRRLLTEFVAARANASADPKARAEQEAFLLQEAARGGLRTGTTLLWPKAEGFVAKGRRRVRTGGTGEEKEEKVFVNVVVSERLAPPTFEKGGKAWQVPNVLGPPRVEKDQGILCVGMVLAFWVGKLIDYTIPRSRLRTRLGRQSMDRRTQPCM